MGKRTSFLRAEGVVDIHPKVHQLRYCHN